MRDKTEEPGTGAIEAMETPSARSRRIVPLLKSGAVAACALAAVTLVVAGFAVEATEAARQSEQPEPASRNETASAASKARESGSERIEKATPTAEPEDRTEEGARSEAASAEAEASPVKDLGAEQDRQGLDAAAGGAPAATPSESRESSSSDGGAAGDVSTSNHGHSWVPETKSVDHPAEYEDVYHKATYGKKVWTQCNACGEDITGRVAKHLSAHAKAGESASYHTEEDEVLVSEAWTEYGVLVKEGYSEEVATGSEVCSECGARR